MVCVGTDGANAGENDTRLDLSTINDYEDQPLHHDFTEAAVLAQDDDAAADDSPFTTPRELPRSLFTPTSCIYFLD